MIEKEVWIFWFIGKIILKLEKVERTEINQRWNTSIVSLIFVAATDE